MSADQIIALLEAITQLAGVAVTLADDAQAVFGSDDRALVEAKLAAIAAANDALAARVAAKLATAAGATG